MAREAARGRTKHAGNGSMVESTRHVASERYEDFADGFDQYLRGIKSED